MTNIEHTPVCRNLYLLCGICRLGKAILLVRTSNVETIKLRFRICYGIIRFLDAKFAQKSWGKNAFSIQCLCVQSVSASCMHTLGNSYLTENCCFILVQAEKP